jgi:hypothetical protein
MRGLQIAPALPSMKVLVSRFDPCSLLGCLRNMVPTCEGVFLFESRDLDTAQNTEDMQDIRVWRGASGLQQEAPFGHLILHTWRCRC